MLWRMAVTQFKSEQSFKVMIAFLKIEITYEHLCKN